MTALRMSEAARLALWVVMFVPNLPVFCIISSATNVGLRVSSVALYVMMVTSDHG